MSRRATVRWVTSTTGGRVRHLAVWAYDHTPDDYRNLVTGRHVPLCGAPIKGNVQYPEHVDRLRVCSNCRDLITAAAAALPWGDA